MVQSLPFGTDGIRGPVNAWPFDPTTLQRLGCAIGTWMLKKKSDPCLVIAQDTRESCHWVQSALSMGLRQVGVRVTVAGVIPAPVLFFLARRGFDAGIMISASHNPYTDNGIKIFEAASGKLQPEDEQRIESLFLTMESTHPSGALFHETSIDGVSAYLATVGGLFPPQFLAGKKIVLDTAHGATGTVAPQLFRQLGAEVVEHANNPDGININHGCGALYPEGLAHRVKAEQADIGFAFDGDGDRVIAVTQHGVIKDGDDLIALLATHPRYAQEKIIVGTIMSNWGLGQHFTHLGKRLIRTPVGDKYIAQALEIHRSLVGGEASGHIILKDHLPSGDGIFVALRALEAMQLTNNPRMTTFTKCPQVHLRVPIIQRHDLGESPFDAWIKEHEELLPDGRLVVRYSGTEPILRIMAEDQSEQMAAQVARSLAQLFEQALR